MKISNNSSLKKISLAVLIFIIAGINLEYYVWKYSIGSNTQIKSYIDSSNAIKLNTDPELHLKYDRSLLRVAFDSTGRIWMASDSVVYVLNKNGEVMETYTQAEIGLDPAIVTTN